METRSSEAGFHSCHVHKTQSIITKFFIFFYSLLLFCLISFRLSSSYNKTPILPWLLVFSSELLLSFFSLLNLSYTWRPVSHTAFPDKLSDHEGISLPDIDVFVFTADPKREPAVEVMNTVISVMGLDYPPEKLAVYISDDGGSPVTLAAAKEAVEYARWWIPFCRKYEIPTRCPKAYFGGGGEEEVDGGAGGVFLQERKAIEERYEKFKECVRRLNQNDYIIEASHPAVIEIINPSSNDAKKSTTKEFQVPKLIYVSREKSSGHPHHFKAGAVNALLRVSSVLTNAPYILMLDCDMFSNDPSSARQAMCFHLDPEISTTLAFVQFPQKFHNLSENDIYGARLRTMFDIKWPGMNGLKGPMVSGTCFYMKRKALYGPIEGADLMQLKQHFGQSNELIKSIQSNNESTNPQTQLDLSTTLLSETKFLASCMYEHDTSWGHEIGFLYGSVVEDYFTGFKQLHCKGWNSVYCNPHRPAFLGTATSSLHDSLVQNTRWQSGVLDVTLSRNFPLVYGPLRMSLMQSLCYAALALQPFYSLPIWCFTTIPQLCLIHGIALYPKASSPWFYIFLACFLASKLKYLHDIRWTGGSVQDWWNEDRMWATRSLTSFMYGTIDAVLKKVGLRQANFIPTNKVDDEENLKLYNMGKFNFQLPTMYVVPLASITLLNMIALVAGVTRVVMDDSADELAAQILLVVYVLVVSYPVIEGMFLRTDNGRIRLSVLMTSALVCLGCFVFGSVLLACFM